MVTIPFLGKLAWDFLTTSQKEIENNFSWTCYIFLLSIFIAMTNQVSQKILLFTFATSI